MEQKRLRRSTDRQVAGVCAGLAEYFGIDPTIMRLAFVALAVMGGHGILVYGVLWLVMPDAAVAGESSLPPSDTSPVKT